MKKILTILGAVCFTLGFAMATGVEQNPIQALYCVVLMAGALVCFKGAEHIASRSEKRKVKSEKFAAAHYQDAA